MTGCYTQHHPRYPQPRTPLEGVLRRRPRGGPAMHCPYCRSTDTRVLDSRVADDGGSIRRRRTCSACAKRFTTVEQMQLTVLKRSGATEPFTRDKAVAGVRKACKGRPVTEDDLACLGQAGRGRAAPRRRRRDPGPRGRPGDPRPAPRPRRGRLPPVRERLPRLRVRRRLRGRDRHAPHGARDGSDRDRTPVEPVETSPPQPAPTG